MPRFSEPKGPVPLVFPLAQITKIKHLPPHPLPSRKVFLRLYITSYYAQIRLALFDALSLSELIKSKIRKPTSSQPK